MPSSFEPGTLESCGAGNFVGGFGMGWYPRPWVCALPSFGKRVFSAVLVRVSSRWKEKETTFPAHLVQGSGWRKKVATRFFGRGALECGSLTIVSMEYWWWRRGAVGSAGFVCFVDPVETK